MGNQGSGSEHPESSEIQALMCNEVLRDWLRHLEHEADGNRQFRGDEDPPRQREQIS